MNGSAESEHRAELRDRQRDMLESGGSPQRKWARTVWGIGKWLVMAVALAYLWRAGTLSYASLRLSPAVFGKLPLAVLFLFLSTAGMGIRFHCLLRCLACPSSAGRQVKIALSGLLAQQIGSDAGFDAMRLICARAMGGRGLNVLAALMMDRLLGLIALTGLAAVGLALFWSDSTWLVPTFTMLAVLVFIPMAFVLCHSLAGAGRLPWLWRIPGTGFAASVGGAIKTYRGHGSVLAALFMLSLIVHVCIFAALYCCGASLTDADLAPSEAFVGGALASFTGLLPLPLAGLGVGEAAFGETVAVMRNTGDVGDLAAVFLLNRLLLLLLGVVCWFWLSVSKERTEKSKKDEANSSG